MKRNQYDMMAEWVEADSVEQTCIQKNDRIIDARHTFAGFVAREGARALRRDCVFINDLMIDASIGIYAEEREKKQPVRISIEAEIVSGNGTTRAEGDNFVCYERIVHGVSAIVRRGHIDLVETLAEDIADFCLGLECVEAVTVRASKPDAIASANDVGVQITRARR